MAGLLLAAVLAAAVASSHAQSPIDQAVEASLCLSESSNLDASTAIAQNCGALGTSAAANVDGTVDLDCPENCKEAYEMLDSDCRNGLASSFGLGTAYQFIFDQCGVEYDRSSGGGSGSPTAAQPTPSPSGSSPSNTGLDISAFACLFSDENIDASERIGNACAPLAEVDTTSTTVQPVGECPAECASAFGDISQDCINDIAVSPAFNTVLRIVFDACDVGLSLEPATDAPSAGGTAAPTRAASGSTPSAAPTAVPSGAPTTATPTADAETEAAPAPATGGVPTAAAAAVPTAASGEAPTPTATTTTVTETTPAPTQAASRAATSMMAMGAAAALAAAALA